ncbi:Lrp/AsnC family transcriptional regulator [Loktanella salsilacus]|jgi:Lrp/AsnC family transcriptional regulator|uniref:Lrp/AsnC family transcriptional regulator n=1 Tax=Loktanella salsilacus TaxID=195913 RepID=UPI001EC0EDE6|nr:Lrp/AsnC family transcriptional regulator [Loktanella salsilacus]MBU0780839.1 Lrp/AsnC family transcriptional regulator [Alphaproteobacteria bacterium]MBU0862036.1 Lrp/AsnC family transcriptional regulator [Alphaproteobacteria bacterium]UTH46483.1 Lrp/AsnC family transcriptional regulator [Loktanella salsilacus]UTH50320.1 Lrp/AsnC family transcriptional regulator [Loktanella salsilacus]|tara:strand:+ start:87 stop:560 length:474 start_codon:yes stop_codon:yes gene_type:complete
MTQSSPANLDHIDVAILRVLQRDASLSQREVADRVGLSQNACWRRMTRLKEAGVIEGQTVRLNLKAIGLDLTVFVMVRTRDHSHAWLDHFRKTVLGIENVIDFYRIAGDYDYMLKIAARDMNHFDLIYQRLTKGAALETVTSYIAMEAIADRRDLPA